MMKKQIRDAKRGISEVLELPVDIIMDLPKLTMIGDMQVSLLNHKGIVEYTENIIRVNTKSGIYKIVGEDLKIKTILSEEIIISGSIKKVEITS